MWRTHLAWAPPATEAATAPMDPTVESHLTVPSKLWTDSDVGVAPESDPSDPLPRATLAIMGAEHTPPLDGSAQGLVDCV